VSRFRRTIEAENDLLSIWRYIAEDKPQAATRLLRTIDEKCALLAENPQLGSARPDIASEARSIAFTAKRSMLVMHVLRPDEWLLH